MVYDSLGLTAAPHQPLKLEYLVQLNRLAIDEYITCVLNIHWIRHSF